MMLDDLPDERLEPHPFEELLVQSRDLRGALDLRHAGRLDDRIGRPEGERSDVWSIAASAADRLSLRARSTASSAGVCLARRRCTRPRRTWWRAWSVPRRIGRIMGPGEG